MQDQNSQIAVLHERQQAAEKRNDERHAEIVAVLKQLTGAVSKIDAFQTEINELSKKVDQHAIDIKEIQQSSWSGKIMFDEIHSFKKTAANTLIGLFIIGSLYGAYQYKKEPESNKIIQSVDKLIEAINKNGNN